MTCADRLTSDSSGQMTSDEDRLTSNSEVARLLEEQERLVLRLEDRLEDRDTRASYKSGLLRSFINKKNGYNCIILPQILY